MAVTECRLMNPRVAGIGLKNEENVTAVFWIRTDDPTQSAISVRTEAQDLAGTADFENALPQPYSRGVGQGTNGSGAFTTIGYCLKADVEQSNDDDKTVWMGRAEFGPLPQNQDETDAVTDPLQRPDKEWVENLEVLEPVTHWIDPADPTPADPTKKLLRDGAGQEFIDPIMQERLLVVLVVQRNLATVQEVIDLGLQYNETVNKTTFRGGAPRTVRFMPLQSSQLLIENNTNYYQVQMRFAYRKETWDRQIVNQGFYYLLGGAGPPKRIKDSDGNDTVQPSLLLADGDLAPLDASGQPVNPEDSILVRNTRKLEEFNDLFP